MKNRLSLIAVCGMSLGLGACDSDYGSFDKDPYPNNIPIAGIWTGTFSYTPPDGSAAHTVNTTLVADEGNEMWMIEQDTTNGCVHLDYGNAFSKQANISGGYGFYSTCEFTDLSSTGTGTISGTADYHVSLSLSFTETDSKNFLYATFSPTFTFEDVYLSGSSLATIQGPYSFTNSANQTAALTIDGSGNVTGATVNSCTATGAISIIDATYDLYRVKYTLANCTASADAYLNGVSLSGLGYYNGTSTTSAPIFQFMAQGTGSNGQPVVFAAYYTAT